MNVPLRILVVFYSRSETTAKFAVWLAAELGADHERLHEIDASRRAGAFGFLRSIVDAMRKRPSRLQPTTHTLPDYDVVVIGTPVWAGRASAPVSTWLSRYGRELPPTVFFFCTMGASGSEKTFAQLQMLTRHAPIATCAISGRDLQAKVEFAKLARFALSIKNWLAAHASQTLAR